MRREIIDAKNAILSSPFPPFFARLGSGCDYAARKGRHTRLVPVSNSVPLATGFDFRD